MAPPRAGAAGAGSVGQMQLQGMNAAGKVFREDRIDHPMPLDARFAGEDARLDGHFKMRASARTPASVAGVLMAHILHLDFGR